MKTYQKVRLLILDEFLPLPIDEEQQRMLLELLERRWWQSATIFCSHFDVSGWHSQLGGGAVADAIMDRIIPGSYKMKLEGDVSMRQRIAAKWLKNNFSDGAIRVLWRRMALSVISDGYELHIGMLSDAVIFTSAITSPDFYG